IAFNNPCSTLSTSGSAAISDSTDVAVSRIVSLKPRENRLIPMPTIAAGPFSVSIVSASIPPSFRSLTQRSLGHLMSTRKPQAFINASEPASARSEEHTSELQSRLHIVCRLLLEKKKTARHRHLVQPPPARDQLISQ